MSNELPPINTFPIETFKKWLDVRNPDIGKIREEGAGEYNVMPDQLTEEQLRFVTRRRFWNDAEFWDKLNRGEYV